MGEQGVGKTEEEQRIQMLKVFVDKYQDKFASNKHTEDLNDATLDFELFFKAGKDRHLLDAFRESYKNLRKPKFINKNKS